MTPDEMATLESQKIWAGDPQFVDGLRRRAARIDAIYDPSVPLEDLDERGRQTRQAWDVARRHAEDPVWVSEMRRRGTEIADKYAG